MSKCALWIRPDDTHDQALEKAIAVKAFRLRSIADASDFADVSDWQNIMAIIADTDCLDTAARFREDLKEARGADLPLLAVSRKTDLSTRLSALRHGASAFFPPPFNAEQVADKLAELAGMSGDTNPYRVMIVDDDPAQANFAAAILGKAGIEVFTVTRSLEVLEAIRSFGPELILMDVYMPDASGVELTTIIREQPDLMDIPIVYLSAEHDPDKQMDALSVGGEDFLTKPIRPKHLVATVRNRIDRARQLSQRSENVRRQDNDPALVRKHILELLERMRSVPAPENKATGLFYLEIDAPILLLERLNLDGIDELMSSIKAMGQRQTREGDKVARFGDFCLVIVAERDSEDELKAIARNLKRSVDGTRFKIANNAISTSVSIGLHLLEGQHQDASQLINEAIKACHKARAAGGEGIHVHRSSDTSPLWLSSPEDNLLDRVGDTENLHIQYQPIIPLKGGPESIYQCLVRLHTSNGGLLAAADFLPTVEQTAKILRLDRWMILKAMIKLHKMRKKGSRELYLMVSQSVSALKDSKRFEWMQDSLEKTGVDPAGLVLEFRFPEIIANPNQARDYLQGLKDLGVGISLNSLRELDALTVYMEQLPSDYIKITENQIRNYPDTWSDLVEKAHEAGKKVIVSRIEHPELLGKLWSNSVDYIQGNFIQSPGDNLNYDFAGAVLQ